MTIQTPYHRIDNGDGRLVDNFFSGPEKKLSDHYFEQTQQQQQQQQNDEEKILIFFLPEIFCFKSFKKN